MKRFVARLVRWGLIRRTRTRPTSFVKRYVRYGAERPRGAQAITLGAKVLALTRGPGARVAEEDRPRRSPSPALRHRLVLNFEGEAEGMDTDRVVANVLEELPELPEDVARLDS